MILTRFFEQRAHPSTPPTWMIQLFGGGNMTAAGLGVSETNAVSWTPLMAGIRFLSETIASLPLHVYQRTGRGKVLLPDHPIARLVRHGPNPEITWFEFQDLSMVHRVLWGNSYAQIIFDQANQPIELWPLNPDRVTVERNSRREIVYRVTLPADDLGSMGGVVGSSVLPADQVHHVRGFSRWGLIGERMTRVAREAIGLGLATEEFGARFLGSGMHAGGILEHPDKLSAEAQERLRAAHEKQVQGLSNAHRLMVLEEGMKWHQTTIEPEKGQFLGLRKFQVSEASRVLRIPPHMLYDLERATFSNIEHQGIEVVVYTLTPWVVRDEQRLNRLISDKMKNVVYTKFNLQGLLRGDIQTRFQAYASARQNGWMSVNDIRELEDMNPVPDGDGYLEPENMRPLGTPPAETNGKNVEDVEENTRFLQRGTYGKTKAR